MADEGRFPGHRYPLSLDSRYASAPLDPALLRAFKKSLPTSGRPSHFVSSSGTTRWDRADHNNTHSQIQGSHFGHQRITNTASNQHLRPKSTGNGQQQQDLLYPVAMFSDFDLPSAEVLCKCLDIFASQFLPYAPFIAGLEMGLTSEFRRDKTPPFLTFAMAAIGALISEDRDLLQWGPNLWLAASHVHSASCEVDNRVARKVDWVTSFIFLGIYGIMHADAELWSKTNIWNGHVDTGAKRMGLNNPHNQSGAAKPHPTNGPKISERTKVMSLYFLVDLLRSLQLGTPPSFHAFDLLIPLSNGLSFRQLYEDVIIDSKSVPLNLDGEDYFLLLLAILSETLVLQRGLGPLFEFSALSNSLEASNSHINEPRNYYTRLETAGSRLPHQSMDISANDANESTPGAHISAYSNPFMAFSASGEYQRIADLLNHALDEWAMVCLSQEEDRYVPKSAENNHSQIPAMLVPLFYFCRLLLSAGPRLLPMIGAVGYCPAKGFKAPDTIRSTVVPEVSDETLTHAWHILEAVEEQQERSSSDMRNQGGPRALWGPIVVFYAGLTVWASLQAPMTTKNGRGTLRMKKMLRLFEMELREMKWPCTSIMADILQDLRNR